MKLKLTIVPTSQFKKDYKRIKKRGYDLGGLHGVLQNSQTEHNLMSKIMTMRSQEITQVFVNAT